MMHLTPEDALKEAAKRRAQDLFDRAEDSAEALRLALEAQGWVEALDARDRLARLLGDLSDRLGAPAPRSLAVTDLDPQAMQDFRRSALTDLAGLRARHGALCRGDWRSGVDLALGVDTRRAAARLAVLCALALAALSGWWAWQERRLDAATDAVNRSRSATAARAVELISFAAWQAERTQGRTVRELARDMAGDCAGIDVRQTLPNHPCREAWTLNGQALFRAAIPAPGKPVDCPSELFFDPWGGPYILTLPEAGPATVSSAGPDGRVGTADDIAAPIPYWAPGVRPDSQSDATAPAKSQNSDLPAR